MLSVISKKTLIPAIVFAAIACLSLSSGLQDGLAAGFKTFGVAALAFAAVWVIFGDE